MQAFILAAGLGTRLQPLTNSKPKALVEIQGTPLIKITIENLVCHGATRIVVNIHHLGNQIIEYLSHNHWNTDILISDERDLLLDTGGGLKKAEPLFSLQEPILVYNVDILSRIDLSNVIAQHTDSMNMATLLVSRRSTSRQLLFDNQRQLAGWRNSTTGETKWSRQPITTCEQMAFSGIAVVEPTMLKLLPPADHPYPIIPAYLEIARNHRISYFEHSPKDWLDVGKPETLQRAQTWYFNS